MPATSRMISVLVISDEIAAFIKRIRKGYCMQQDLSVIFEKEPRQWGLRGDPFMWSELRDECVGKNLTPYHEDEIVSMVCQKFELVSGVPLTYDAEPYVEKYAHGGMSSGYLYGLFWIGRGMAQILQNYREAIAGMNANCSAKVNDGDEE